MSMADLGRERIFSKHWRWGRSVVGLEDLQFGAWL